MNNARLTTPDDTRPACSCAKGARSTNSAMKWTTAGGVLAALGVCAACCLLPFALLSIGVTGAWVSTVDSLAKYKWIFIALTAAFLGYGFYAAYWRPRRTCAAGATLCPGATSLYPRPIRSSARQGGSGAYRRASERPCQRRTKESAADVICTDMADEK